MKYFLLCLFVFFLGSQMLWAQEELVPLSTYPDIIKAKKKPHASPKSSTQLSIPFVDDFSINSFKPSSQKWVGNSAYVNKNFAVNPPSIGVLTFDAVNDTGGVYPYASQFAFIADSITSQSIRLDSAFGNNPHALSPADSLYFSFYFQPQGMGNAPESEDSLILQFFNPQTQQWKLVWEHEGMPLDTFKLRYGVDFKKVMIPITNPDYFAKGFRVRFMNMASIPNTQIPSWRSGLYDHWHVDYVYLDEDRSWNELSINDITFTQSFATLLNNYVSMPWNQYQANANAETNLTASINLRNMDLITPKNVNQYFSVQDLTNNNIVTSLAFPSTINMNAGASVNYSPNYTQAVFQSTAVDFADFEVQFRLLSNTPPMDIIRANDTMRFYQRFYNYYAYDDGTPEAGYGLSLSGAKLAYKFTLNTPDSLQAIQFYFNNTLNLANQKYFMLTVWDDQNGQPGSIIYQQSGVRPMFSSNLFQYVTYELDDALYLTGTFYIGWQQTTGDNLNVGFDLNHNHKQHTFFNTSGSWQQSSKDGALMIRPILGAYKDAIVAVPEIKQKTEPQSNLRIYPNPAHQADFLQIELLNNNSKDMQGLLLEMYDVSGRLVLKTAVENDGVRLPAFRSGMYILVIRNSSEQIIHKEKLIIR